MDVSHWKRDTKSQASGTRKKYWLIDPLNDQKLLFKVPREGTGEYWAEALASQIGRKLGFDVMEAQIATYKGTVGTVVQNFVNKNE